MNNFIIDSHNNSFLPPLEGAPKVGSEANIQLPPIGTEAISINEINKSNTNHSVDFNATQPESLADEMKNIFKSITDQTNQSIRQLKEIFYLQVHEMK